MSSENDSPPALKAPPHDPPRHEALERELDRDIDLYKFYLELLLKGAAFSLGVTGALLSYYIAQQENRLIPLALPLPIVINGGFALVCFAGIQPAKIFRNDHARTSKAAGIHRPYEMAPLIGLLRVFSWMFILVAAGLLALLLVELAQP